MLSGQVGRWEVSLTLMFDHGKKGRGVFIYLGSWADGWVGPGEGVGWASELDLVINNKRGPFVL